MAKKTTLKPIELYTHKDKDRVNNSQIGLVAPKAFCDATQSTEALICLSCESRADVDEHPKPRFRGLERAYRFLLPRGMNHFFRCVLIFGLASCGSVESTPQRVGHIEAALAAQDWTPPALIANGPPNPNNPSLVARYNGAQLAFVVDQLYAVMTDGLWGASRHPLWLTKLVGGTWQTPAFVPGVVGPDAELEAFNGRLYLLTKTDGAQTMSLSRYDPTPGTWSPPSTLPFPGTSAGMGVHDGKLVLVGSLTFGGPMWLSSMDATGQFTPAVTLPFIGQRAAVASWHGTLFIFFQNLGGDAFFATFDGVRWSAPAALPTGVVGQGIVGEPSAAVFSNALDDCLHVAVYQLQNVPQPSTIWWTYRCGAATGFAVPTALHSGMQTGDFSLAASANELLLGLNLGWGLQVAERSYRYPAPDGSECTLPVHCVSGACITSWSDLDGDGFGAGAALTRCGPPPQGRVTSGGDCCDSDPRARPGQSQYFSAPSNCGSFDFDCDGSPSRAFPVGTTCEESGSCSAGNVFCDGAGEAGWEGSPPAGVAATFVTSCSEAPVCNQTTCPGCTRCVVRTATRTQGCR
jgi:hypothetical protein